MGEKYVITGGLDTWQDGWHTVAALHDVKMGTRDVNTWLRDTLPGIKYPGLKVHGKIKITVEVIESAKEAPNE